MKKLLLLFAFTGIALHSIAQDELEEGNYHQAMDVSKYKDSVFGTTFATKFSDEESQKNFRKLREYLSEKEVLCESIRAELKRYPRNVDETSWVDNKIEALKKLTSGKRDNAWVYVPIDYLYVYYDNDYMQAETDSIKKKVADVNELVNKYEKQKKLLSNRAKEYDKLTKNLNVIKQDIYECQNQIDSALAPEYKEQEFRKNVSYSFALVMGGLLLVFFLIIYMRSDSGLYKELLGGNGLQFLTLFVLIISIVLFGILGILEGKELSAILAGISGYVLGKGLPDKQTAATGTNNNDTVTKEQKNTPPV